MEALRVHNIDKLLEGVVGVVDEQAVTLEFGLPVGGYEFSVTKARPHLSSPTLLIPSRIIK
jgi:hypothetical protein